MADQVGIKVAKWVKLTDAAETKTAEVVTRGDGVDALAVDVIIAESSSGSTVQHSDTVDTVGILFPAPAGNNISEFLIHCPENQGIDDRLLISMDGSNPAQRR